MGVFYRRDRLDLVKRGNFWLSETPEVVGSNTWNTPFPRMVTWGQFEDKASGKRFYFFNTHFPYRDEDEPVRTKEAQVLLDQIAKIDNDGTPLVLTAPESPAGTALRTIAEALSSRKRGLAGMSLGLDPAGR